uniref:Cytidine monophosphate (UMP-CMP) kinase 2, mitochondrial n=1 Tax=Astyanax mexicanus TaxID=7994 RepID=A0A8B9RN80_ASTMX
MHEYYRDIFRNILNSSILLASSVLTEPQFHNCRDIIPESKEVLEIVNQQLEACRRDIGFPVVVIEGLDATGDVYNFIYAAILLFHLIRKYALLHTLSATNIGLRMIIWNPISFCLRYWHSTAAYAIATAVSGAVEKLPALGSEIYEWPSDLLRPSLVLLLTVSPRERLRRLQGRGLGQTEEETQLEVNDLFRQKVDEAYKRIQNPACVTVDASPSPDQVLQQVLSLIRNKCHL